MITITELKDRIYQDFVSSFENAITPLRRSFFDITSNTLAATFYLLYIFLSKVQKESFLTTCSEDRVTSYFAPLKNIEQKDATASTGTVTFTGIDGTEIPNGTRLTYNSMDYKTSEAGEISSGYATLSAESLYTGTTYNTIGDISLYLRNPLSGLDNKVTSIDGFSGAIDDETIESLRTRTRQKFGVASQIDNDNYYKSLANEVDNVKASFISDNKNGVGTFGVTILTSSNDGIPVQDDIDAVEEYFEDSEAVPVYVGVEFFMPSISYIDFTIQLTNNTVDNQETTEQSIRDYLYLNQKPNTTFEWEGLSDYLKNIGARLLVPNYDDSYIIQDDEVLDIGDITWV